MRARVWVALLLVVGLEGVTLAPSSAQGGPSPMTASLPQPEMSPASISASPALPAWPSFGSDAQNSFDPPFDVIPANLNPFAAWFVGATGPVTGSPVASGETAYFETRSGGEVYAVDLASGQVKWRRRLAGAQGNPLEMHGGPLLSDGGLYVATALGTIYDLSPETGDIVWKSEPLFDPNGTERLHASPKAMRGVIYQSVGGNNDMAGEYGGVVALDEQTGQILWKRLFGPSSGGSSVFSPPALYDIPGGDGLVIVGTGNPITPADDDGSTDAVIALDARTGVVVWVSQTHANDYTDSDFLAAPNLWRLPDGSWAVGDGEKDGSYYAFAADTGAPLWQTSLVQDGSETLVIATAAVSGGRIFVGTMDVPSDADWGAGYQKPNGGRLFCLDAATGNVLWSFDLGGTLATAPLATGRLVFAEAANGTLYALRAADGGVAWQAHTGNKTSNAEAALALAGGVLLAPSAAPGGLAGWRLD